MIVFLDVDEVLADFTGGALALHGFSRAELEAKRVPGQWDVPKPLGLTATEFWKPISKVGARFWEELKLLPWAEELLAKVKLLTKDHHELYLLTSPSEEVSAYEGKINWINKHFKGTNYIITEHKHLVVGRDRILIDDRESNIKTFTDKGGRGVLFPSKGNSLHRYHYNPVEYTILTFQDKLYSGDKFPCT